MILISDTQLCKQYILVPINYFKIIFFKLPFTQNFHKNKTLINHPLTTFNVKANPFLIKFSNFLKYYMKKGKMISNI